MRRHIPFFLLLALATPAVADSWIGLLFDDGHVDRTPDEPGYPKSDIPLDPGEPMGLHHYRLRLDYLVAMRGVATRMETGEPVRLDLYADDTCEGQPYWSGWLGLTSPQVVVHDLARWEVDPAGLAVATTELRTVQDIYVPEELRAAFLVIDDPGLTPVGTRCQPQRLSRIPKTPDPIDSISRDGQAFSSSSFSVTADTTELIVTPEEYDERLDLGSAHGQICFLSKIGVYSAELSDGSDAMPVNASSCSVWINSSGHWEVVGYVSTLRDDDATGAEVRCVATCVPLSPMEDLVY